MLKHFETRLCAQNTLRMLNWALTSFSVCMFKLLFVFVRSDAEGDERELGSVLLSMRRGSLREHRARRASTQLSFSASCV